MMIKVYAARKIHTMDPNIPDATHVAVRNGIVLAVGGADCGAPWGESRLDRRFEDKVILPGLVEAHAHVMAGGVWQHPYVGHYSRTDHMGKLWTGATTYEEIVRQLQEQTARVPRGQFVMSWGYDPSFLEGPRMDRHLLDRVSVNHPVVVMHSNFHLLTANSLALEVCGIEQLTGIDGICRAEDGSLTGELQEFDAMDPVLRRGKARAQDFADEDSVRRYGELARRSGITTIADLYSILDQDEVDMLHSVTSGRDFPVRYAPVMSAMGVDPAEAVSRARGLMQQSTAKLHLGSAKLFTDGAIQGRTAMLKPPGYLSWDGNGIWNMEMEQFRESVAVLHRAGIKVHVHANGDEASEQTISAFEDAMLQAPNPDLRHTVEHAQLAGIDQFKRMRALGLTVNLFANHLHYFGDIHWTKSLGPDRACRMNACADAWRTFGGDFAIHSDSPVTPLAPLKTASFAVNRQTMGGRVLGTSQCLTVAQSLYCITLGAAYVLKLDDRIGSIQCGKYADFCVLEEDPLEVDPSAFGEIPIYATVLGGEQTN